MPCAKTDARTREDPSKGGGGVNPVAVIFRRTPSIPDAGYESGFEAKEAGSMLARRQREGKRRERNTKKSTEKNSASKRGQTADDEKNKKRGDFVATAGVVPCPLVQQNPALSLQVVAWGFDLV